jgi:hypothetical protein
VIYLFTVYLLVIGLATVVTLVMVIAAAIAAVVLRSINFLTNLGMRRLSLKKGGLLCKPSSFRERLRWDLSLF